MGKTSSGFIFNNSLDVNIQSQTSPLFQFFAMQSLKSDILLTSPITAWDEIVNVTPGHGFTAGSIFVIWGSNIFSQIEVKSVSTNAITLIHPIVNPYTVEDTIIERGNIHLNVDGSGTPVEFNMNLQNYIIPIDVSKVIITMHHGSNVPDDGKFGGLSALTNGIFIVKDNGIDFNLGLYRTNKDFRDRGSSVDYSTKAPSGTNATTIIFDIETIFGQVIRFNPRLLDVLRIFVRDKIDSGAGMADMTLSIIGSYTSGE